MTTYTNIANAILAVSACSDFFDRVEIIMVIAKLADF